MHNSQTLQSDTNNVSADNTRQIGVFSGLHGVKTGMNVLGWWLKICDVMNILKSLIKSIVPPIGSWAVFPLEDLFRSFKVIEWVKAVWQVAMGKMDYRFNCTE